MNVTSTEVFKSEVEGFLRALACCHGYDFSGYHRAFVEERLAKMLTSEAILNVSRLQERCLRDRHFLRHRVLPKLTVSTTSMFRDAGYFTTLSQKVFPTLATYPSINIWHAGCSTGEEVYSLAILLHEAGLLEKALVYGTDINPAALKIAADAKYDMTKYRLYASLYRQAGGKGSLSDYFTLGYGYGRVVSAIRDRVNFIEHNLIADEAFLGCHLVLCRNVLIYMSRELQDQVLGKLVNSLIYRGFVGLGRQETVLNDKIASGLEVIDDDFSVYQKSSRLPVPEFNIGKGPDMVALATEHYLVKT